MKLKLYKKFNPLTYSLYLDDVNIHQSDSKEDIARFIHYLNGGMAYDTYQDTLNNSDELIKTEVKTENLQPQIDNYLNAKDSGMELNPDDIKREIEKVTNKLKSFAKEIGKDIG